MNIPESSITSKGQTTVPVEIRKMLELKPNNKILWIVLRPGEVSIVPMHKNMKKDEWIENVCGKYVNKSVDALEWLIKDKKRSIKSEKKLLKK